MGGVWQLGTWQVVSRTVTNTINQLVVNNSNLHLSRHEQKVSNVKIMPGVPSIRMKLAASWNKKWHLRAWLARARSER